MDKEIKTTDTPSSLLEQNNQLNNEKSTVFLIMHSVNLIFLWNTLFIHLKAEDGVARLTAIPGVEKNQTWLSHWTTKGTIY